MVVTRTNSHILIVWLICFYSCNEGPATESTDKINKAERSAEVQKIEPDLSDIRTARGNIIKYKRTGDTFQIQWFQNGELRTFSDFSFEVYGAASWIPRYVDENKNYVLLRAGCGSPCWLGLFLPLTGDQSAKLIHEYLAYDLNQNYVAHLADDYDSLEVLNLRSRRSQRFKLPDCKAAFKGWCVDTMFFNGNTLKFSWDPSVNWQVKEEQLQKLQIGI